LLSCSLLFDALTAQGISFFVGVPDSLLKHFCFYLADHAQPSQHIITANEGSAVALAVGHHLATGSTPLVYMQNSGLGNAINPLTSLADSEVYGIPMLLLIGWRGEPGKKDEPQHVKMGKVTVGLLEAVGIPHGILPRTPSAAQQAIEAATQSMISHRTPYALLVRRNTFEPHDPANERRLANALGREKALELILDALEPDAPVVSTTGMPSRELYEIRERRHEGHDSDFLTVGSMGHCSQIALGVALSRPRRDLYCIDGDGALIMHMGGLATIGSLSPSNFKHVVLNNGAHDSVGGQPTAGFEIDLCVIARANGYKHVFRAESADSLRDCLRSLKESEGPSLLEVRIEKGARADLGRPTQTPERTKQQFMRFLQR